MANMHRGEIEAELDGKRYRLCLTLGALAELEHAFGEDDMLAVVERFETGRITARDTIRIIGAGLRGAGYDSSDEDVSAMRVDGGANGYVEIVAALLLATFGTTNESDGEAQSTPGKPQQPQAHEMQATAAPEHSGAEIDVSITTTTTAHFLGFGLVSVRGLDNTTPTNTPVGGTSDPQDLSVNVSAGGIIVGTAFAIDANPPDISWTGITEVGQSEEDAGGSAWSFSMAYGVFAEAQTPQAVSAGWTGTNVGGSIAAPFR